MICSSSGKRLRIYVLKEEKKEEKKKETLAYPEIWKEKKMKFEISIGKRKKERWIVEISRQLPF